MSDAVIALLGVLGGALLTGLPDQLNAARLRRREAHAAAQLLAADLMRARHYFRLASFREEWWKVDLTDSTWVEYRDRLALGLSSGDFHWIAGAFYIVGSAEDARKLGERFDDTMVEEGVDRIETAISIVERHAETLRDRIRRAPKRIVSFARAAPGRAWRRVSGLWRGAERVEAPGLQAWPDPPEASDREPEDEDPLVFETEYELEEPEPEPEPEPDRPRESKPSGETQ